MLAAFRDESQGINSFYLQQQNHDKKRFFKKKKNVTKCEIKNPKKIPKFQEVDSKWNRINKCY